MTVEHSTELTPRCKINNNLTLKFMDGVKKFAKDVKTISRRKSVIDRLEKQLKAGVKPEKGTLKNVPLTDSDINRIKRELETLKTRLI